MRVARVLVGPLLLMIGGCALVAGDRGTTVSVEERPVVSGARPPSRPPAVRPPEPRLPEPPPVAAPLPAPEPAEVVALPLPPVAVPSRPPAPPREPPEALPAAPPPPAPPVPPGAIASLPERGLPRAAPSRSPAVAALTSQAGQQARAGDLEQAAASLERAVRIEPDNAWVWHQLALVRLFQRQDDQAAQLAARSNALTADAALQARNWRVIAQAKERAGDAEEAASAAARARSLGGD
ncbi:MAG: tetratricopeptide repeat protein [Gammaproteobacteria bacterium]|nr:tetratricopeptide repeat protein [Gammaproteobacteria bacterium]